MKVKSKANVQIFEDTRDLNPLYAPSDDGAQWIATNYEEESSGRFSIAASGSFSPPFGSVTACDGINISAEAAVNVNINGLGNISLTPPDGAAVGTPCRLHIEGTITSVVITNPSATAAVEGRFVLWGDPV